MRFVGTFTTLITLAVSRALAQEIGDPIDFEDGIHNVTAIWGTWSSGSQKVLTGPGFANPVESSFTYPEVAGISYSFTDDYFFEEALYRFQGNGTDPRCIVGIIQYQHGKYELLRNGSIVLHPFAQDGRQQVQDTCAAESNVLRQFNQTTLFGMWRIFRDPQGRAKLHLHRFDLAPFAPMFQVSRSPTMNPTRVLTNTTIGAVAPSRLKKRGLATSAATHTNPSLLSTALALGATACSLFALL